MTSALADDWRDVPPPVVPHPRDAYARGLMPWDTAPRPAPVAPTPKPRPALPLEAWRTLAAGLARRAP